MKKLQLLFAIFALPLFADGPSNDDLQREIDQLRMRVDRMSSGSEMPAGSAESRASNGFNISADLLYWQTQSDYINYALMTSQTNYNNVPQDNKFFEPKIDWAWGFRVGAGYQFEYDNWKLQAEYTWLRPKGGSSVTIDDNASGSIVLVEMSPGISTSWGTDGSIAAKNATTTFSLDYNYVTLQLAKNFCVSSHIDLTTHFGLGAGWMDTTQVTTYSGGTPVTFLNTNQLVTTMDNNYWGVGPVAGLGAFWHMGFGFSLFADTTAEILVGKSRTSRVEQVNSSESSFVKYTFDSYRYRPQLFMQLGLAYDAYFNDASQHFGLRAGWENQIWYSQMISLSDYNFEKYGDLQFSGLTIKALFEF